LRRAAILGLERGLRLKNRVLGIGRHAHPERDFGPGGVDEAERLCLEASRDVLGWGRPPRRLPPPAGVVREVRAAGTCTEVRLAFDSPLPSGEPRNDRVHVRLYVPPGCGPGSPVALFHHPVYQCNWALWTWFLSGVAQRMPVAIVAAPHHMERTMPGRYPGQGTINANPWRLFEACRQWAWDQQSARDLLRAQGFEPTLVIGFSMGAFNTLMTAAAGALDLPIVAIACTNRYAWGLQRGLLGGPIVKAMRRVGIDDARLARMVDAVQLERYVPVLRGRPILSIRGAWDEVDPEPSGARLEAALRPSRSVTLPGGHGSLILYRRAIVREILGFAEQTGVRRLRTA
jgi:pimeloyl-ACP methyl ester carboxylesterase